VTLPLRAGDDLVGLLALAFRAERTFEGTLPSTLLAMAEQQALAIECARGLEQTAVRARLSLIVREVAEGALGAASDEETWDALLAGASRVCGTPAARLALFDGRGVLRAVRSSGLPTPAADVPPLESGDSLVVRLRASERPQLIEQAQIERSTSAWAGPVLACGFRSVVLLPLRLRGESLGLITSYATTLSRRFRQEELTAMTLLASVAASAVEARRQRRAADAQRARLGQIVEWLPEAVAVLDSDGVFEEVNAAYRALVPLAAIGIQWSSTVSPHDVRTPKGGPVPFDELHVSRALRGERPPPSDFRLLVGAGWRNLVAHSAPLRDDGELTGVVVAVQDVTALRDLADAKDRFLDIASHELRSPLAAVRACTALLELDPTVLSDDSRRRQLASRIQHQVDRLVLLVDELVEMARVRGGTIRLTRARFDLGDVAREVAELSQLQSRSHPIRVVAPAPVEGDWDRQRLAQVLTNLVSNAARYSPAGGEILVRVEVRGPDAAVAVEDHGIGITPEERERLFEPYFRGPTAGKVARGGLGLGLHLSNEIVRLHDGRIEVESEPGRGSCFTVLLPRGT
jgi:signal transduction histidine kinase